MDAFDHFIKEMLGVRHYIRYTDDAVILHEDRGVLELMVPLIEGWLSTERRLRLHPAKTSIRKVSQGIDFLGYIILPHHTVLRTKTKRRMLKRLSAENAASYLGLLQHATAFNLEKEVRKRASPPFDV